MLQLDSYELRTRSRQVPYTRAEAEISIVGNTVLSLHEYHRDQHLLIICLLGLVFPSVRGFRWQTENGYDFFSCTQECFTRSIAINKDK